MMSQSRIFFQNPERSRSHSQAQQSNDTQNALNFLKKAEENEHLNETTYTHALNVIARSHNPDVAVAVKLFNDAKKRNFADNITYNTVLNVIAKSRKPNIELAQNIFHEAKKNRCVNEITYNIMLDIIAHSRNPDVALAESLFEEAKHLDLIDEIPYSNMIKVLAYSFTPDVERAIELYKESIDYGCLTSLVFNNVLNVIARSHDPDAQLAQEIFLKAKELKLANAVTYGTMLYVIANCRDPNVDFAKSIFIEATKLKFCNPIACSSMFGVIANSADPDVKLAQSVFQIAKDHHVVDRIVFASILNVIAKSHNPDVKLAQSFLTEARNRNLLSVQIYNTMLDVIAKSSNPHVKLARDILDEAQKHGYADGVTYATMLNVIANSRKPNIEFAKKILKEAERFDCNTAGTYNCMLAVIARCTNPDVELAKHILTEAKLRHRINTATFAIMIKVIAKSLNPDIELAKAVLTDAEKFRYIDAGTYVAMIKLLLNQKSVDRPYVEKLLNSARTKLMDKPILSNLLLKMYFQLEQCEEAVAFFHSIENKNLMTYTTMLTGLTQHFTLKQLPLAQKLLQDMEGFLLPKERYYRTQLSQLMFAYQQFFETLHAHLGPKRRPKYETVLLELQRKTREIVTQFRDLLLQSDMNLSIGEAKILSIYFPNEDFAPKHQAITNQEIEDVKTQAYQQLNHDLVPLSDDPQQFEITEVNRFGKRTGEYHLNDSIYANITAHQFAHYLIIKFDKPVKANRLPLFFYYEGELYRADAWAGSKIKTKISENIFGGMIAIKANYARFFRNTFLTFDESIYYAQRAFLPEEADRLNKGLKGRFRMAVIPDAMRFAFMGPFIVQDGWGYIKKSLADEMGIKPPKDQKLTTSYLSYQATQSYYAVGYDSAIDAFARYAAPTMLELKACLEKGDKPAAELLTKTYACLSGGLPKYSATILPVNGNVIWLPDTSAWRKATKAGVMIGRNPYSAKRLRVIPTERIGYSNELTQMCAFQYTLTGYSCDQGQIKGRFFKGMLGVIENAKWPVTFSNYDLVTSSKDQKLCSDFLSAQDKTQAQNPAQSIGFDLHAVMINKGEIDGSHLCGLTDDVMEACAADFDGDEVDIVPLENVETIGDYVQAQNEGYIANPKSTKTCTPSICDGHFDKIYELYANHLIEDWNQLANFIYFLPQDTREKIAEEMVQTHQLEALLGPSWQQKLGLPIDQITPVCILLVEIQLGLKFGEDISKTKVPIVVLAQRLEDYQKVLRKIDPQLSITYGKGLKKRLLATINDDHFHAEKIMQLLRPLAEEERSENFVQRTQLAAMSIFVHGKKCVPAKPKMKPMKTTHEPITPVTSQNETIVEQSASSTAIAQPPANDAIFPNIDRRMLARFGLFSATATMTAIAYCANYYYGP